MKANQLNAMILESQPILKRVAFKFTQDPNEIEELVQETLVRSLSSLERFISHPKLHAFLFVIMRNTYINKYRSINRRRKVETELAHTNHFTEAIPNNSEGKLVLEDIHAAINNLSNEKYTAFTMFMEGYKYHEIAEHLEIPEGTVKTRIHQARKTLKNTLKIYR